MVHFVGAGCGAADLITLRGDRLIREADVIIYAGSLVNPELLIHKKESCVLYDSAQMTLEEIFAVMQEAEKKKYTTVRLHSGDPSLYGAVREQMDLLDEAGIAYDSCPGVSAMAGAASSLNLEYTLPGISQSVIVTRMAGRTEVPQKEKIASLAEHQATMVIFLSASKTKELSERLLAGGYPPDTPAAIVYRATWPDERSWLCTVSTLDACAKEHDITKTALILVGEAVAQTGYHRSVLYDPACPTGFRDAKKEQSR